MEEKLEVDCCSGVAIVQVWRRCGCLCKHSDFSSMQVSTFDNSNSIICGIDGT